MRTRAAASWQTQRKKRDQSRQQRRNRYTFHNFTLTHGNSELSPGLFTGGIMRYQRRLLQVTQVLTFPKAIPWQDAEKLLAVHKALCREKDSARHKPLTGVQLSFGGAFFFSLFSARRRSARSTISKATETLKRGPAMLKIGLAAAGPAFRASL